MSTSLYEPLNYAKKEFRLLHCSPSQCPDHLDCRMEVVSLDDDPQYFALSYVWGNEPPKHTIHVNSYEMLVTTNLKSALVRWSSEGLSQGLWADAVCIDQNATEEKGSQILLMREIYSKSFATIVWLGVGTEDEEQHINAAFKCIQRFANVARENDLFNIPSDWQEKDDARRSRVCSLLESISIDDSASADIPIWSLHAFTMKDWWRRVWTFQEAALAQQIFIIGVKGFLYGAWIDEFTHLVRLRMVMKPKTPEHDIFVQSSESICNFLSVSCSHFSLKERYSSMSLLDALRLSRLRGRECSDPRDHYFGLLGLIDPDCTEMQHLRGITYRDSVVEIYIAVANALLRSHGLDVLSYCNSTKVARITDYDGSGLSPTLGLPSWAPDWTKGSFIPLQGQFSEISGKLYNASRCLNNSEEDIFTINGSSLQLRGFTVDSIQGLAPILSSDTLELSKDERTVKSWAPWLRTIVDFLGDSSPYHKLETKLLAILRTSVADLELHENRPLHRRKNSREDIATFTELFDIYMAEENTTTFENASRGVQRYLKSVHMLAVRWRIFTTKNGRLGLGLLENRPGDIVCIFQAASIPFVLRPCEGKRLGEERYIVVGEVYVHELMDGEYDPSPGEYRNFTIV